MLTTKRTMILVLGMLAPIFAHASMSAPSRGDVLGPSLREEVGLFGQTDTRRMAYDLPIFKAIHPLTTAKNGSCSAFLIHQQYALTAAHCVEGGTPQYLRIDRGGGSGRKIPISQVWVGENKSWEYDDLGRRYLQEDMALLRLAAPAPSDVELLEIATPQEVQAGVSAMSVGYPGYTYSSQFRIKGGDCLVRSLFRDIIRTDCAMSGGNSGGPLLVWTSNGKWKAAGISSTQYVYADTKEGRMVIGEPYSDEKANYFSNITKSIERIRKIIAEDNRVR